MKRISLLAAIFLLLVSGGAFAGAPSDDFRLDAPPLFPKGTMAAVSWVSYTSPVGYSRDKVYDASVGFSYYVWNNHALNLVADGYHVDQTEGHTAEGSAISLLGRYHFINRDPFTVYLDGGCGLSWFNSAMPKGGTTYDYNPRVGVGVGFHLSDRVWLTTGARYFHYSNARVHGPDKNPSYQGIEYYVGLLIPLN